MGLVIIWDFTLKDLYLQKQTMQICCRLLPANTDKNFCNALILLKFKKHFGKNRLQTQYQNRNDACRSILMFSAAASPGCVERRLWMHSGSPEWREYVVHFSVAPAETLEWKGSLWIVVPSSFLSRVSCSFIFLPLTWKEKKNPKKRSFAFSVWA